MTAKIKQILIRAYAKHTIVISTPVAGMPYRLIPVIGAHRIARQKTVRRIKIIKKITAARIKHVAIIAGVSIITGRRCQGCPGIFGNRIGRKTVLIAQPVNAVTAARIQQSLAIVAGSRRSGQTGPGISPYIVTIKVSGSTSGFPVKHIIGLIESKSVPSTMIIIKIIRQIYQNRPLIG